MITLYGIKNCDTVKKARRWLDQHGVEYHFHDLRNDGLEPTRLNAWIAAAGWEKVLNRRGTTWRRLPEELRGEIDERRAGALMLEHPTLIKRPIVEFSGGVLIGFVEKEFAEKFAAG